MKTDLKKVDNKRRIGFNWLLTYPSEIVMKSAIEFWIS